MSLARTIAAIRKDGIKKFWRDLNYIGDAKTGRLVGTDRYVSPLLMISARLYTDIYTALTG